MENEKTLILNLLKTSRGQIEAVIKMIEEDKYCIDILNQILAVQGLIKKSNSLLLQNHLRYCIKEAFLNNEGEEKMNEVAILIDKYIK